MHISGYPTMREIMVAGNTLNFHIAPYASGFLNQSVNMWYAYIRGDVPLMVHRMCGIAANTYYLSTYLAYSAPSKAADNKRWLMFVGGLLLSLAVYLHVLLPLSGSSHLYNSSIALAGALTGVALAAAPLATVREVLRTKDASSFPGTLVLMQFLQFTSWTIYGWVVTDWSTFANNLVGVVLGGLQLCLIAFYGASATPPPDAPRRRFPSFRPPSPLNPPLTPPPFSLPRQQAPRKLLQLLHHALPTLCAAKG
jgi:solute carrier family 50 protein (sugar transporter)